MWYLSCPMVGPVATIVYGYGGVAFGKVADCTPLNLFVVLFFSLGNSVDGFVMMVQLWPFLNCDAGPYKYLIFSLLLHWCVPFWLQWDMHETNP